MLDDTCGKNCVTCDINRASITLVFLQNFHRMNQTNEFQKFKKLFYTKIYFTNTKNATLVVVGMHRGSILFRQVPRAVSVEHPQPNE